jgi:hypothetical protein
MQDKDWTGNKNSIFKTLGASNHTDKDRQNEDYYATDPIAAELLLEVEQFSGNIWECSSGEDHLANVFKERGYNVRTSDIIPRTETTEVLDFLSPDNNELWDGDIITNPPYKFAVDFIYKALELIPDGKKVAMFLKIQFLEGKERKKLFTKYPPKVVYVSSSRILCAKNANFEEKRKEGSAVAYAWYVWEKGFKGDTVVKWIN